ncbi:MAG: hypothetical protein AAF226_10770 [Verrucomicrobiota bacterium]
MIRSFSAAGAELTAVSYDHDEEPQGDGSDYYDFVDEDGIEWRLGSLGQNPRVQSVLSKYPAESQRLRMGGAYRIFKRALSRERWDVVVVDHVALGWAIDELDSVYFRKAEDRPMVVYVSHGNEARSKRLAARDPNYNPLDVDGSQIDSWKVSKMEQLLLQKSDLVTAITEGDLESYRREDRNREYVCLTPGYDSESEFEFERVLSEETPYRVVILGSCDSAPRCNSLNRFLDDAVEPFAEAGIELQVIGKVCSDYSAKAGRTYPNVRFEGQVEDPADYLHSARIGMVVNQCPAGLRMKSLECIFNKTPLFSLANHMDGLPLVSPEHFIRSASVKGLVDETIATMDDLGRLNQMQRDAYSICEDAYRWSDRGQALFDRIEGLRHLSLAR